MPATREVNVYRVCCLGSFRIPCQCCRPFDVFLHRLAAASLIPAPLPAVRRLLP
jgi:hypothetical protein